MNVTIERAFEKAETTEIDTKYIANILMVHIDFYSKLKIKKTIFPKFTVVVYKSIRVLLTGLNCFVCIKISEEDFMIEKDFMIV